MSNLFPHPDASYGIAGVWEDDSGVSGDAGHVAAYDTSWVRWTPDTFEDLTRGRLLYLGPAIDVAGGQVLTVRVEVAARIGGDSPDLVQATFVLRFSTGSAEFVAINNIHETDGVRVHEEQIVVPAGATTMTLDEVTFVSQSLVPFDTDNNINGTGYGRFRNLYVGEYAPDGSDTPEPPDPNPPFASDFDTTLEVGVPAGNLIGNPSGEAGPFGWSVAPGSAAGTINTVGEPGWTFLRAQAATGAATAYRTNPFEVEPDLFTGLRIRWGGCSGDARVGVRVEWYDATQLLLSETAETIVDPATAVDAEYNFVTQAPAGAFYARVRLDQYRWTGSAGPPFAGDHFDYREVTVLQSAVLGDVDDLQPFQAATVNWTDVLADSHELSIERGALEPGLLTATVWNDAYDPTIGGFIVPGLAVRVRARDDTDRWPTLYTGRVDDVQVTYPRAGTRIVLNASDNAARVASLPESRGVGTVDELPFILADKGVPWSCNGSGGQIAAAELVSANDNASTLDQVVLTRDSDAAYAWVDRHNVLTVANRGRLPAVPVVEYSDVADPAPVADSYSDVDAAFDTTATINVVTIVYLRYDPATGDTTEVRYGPYADGESITQWGAYAAEFTVHGITEDAATLQGFADQVFALNAQPQVRASGISVPVKDGRGRTHAAAVDLYTMVRVAYADKVDASVRVTAIRHTITATRRKASQWKMGLRFDRPDGVAAPLFTPSPPTVPTAAPEPEPIALDDLVDVDATAPTDGATLVYDASTNTWEAADPTSATVQLTPTMAGVVGHAFYIKQIAPGVIAASGYIDVDDTDTSRRDTGMRIPAGWWPLGQVIVAAPVVGNGSSYRYFFGTDGVIEFEQDGANAGPFEGIVAIWFTD